MNNVNLSNLIPKLTQFVQEFKSWRTEQDDRNVEFDNRLSNLENLQSSQQTEMESGANVDKLVAKIEQLEQSLLTQIEEIDRFKDEISKIRVSQNSVQDPQSTSSNEGIPIPPPISGLQSIHNSNFKDQLKTAKLKKTESNSKAERATSLQEKKKSVFDDELKTAVKKHASKSDLTQIGSSDLSYIEQPSNSSYIDQSSSKENSIAHSPEPQFDSVNAKSKHASEEDNEPSTSQWNSEKTKSTIDSRVADQRDNVQDNTSEFARAFQRIRGAKQQNAEQEKEETFAQKIARRSTEAAQKWLGK